MASRTSAFFFKGKDVDIPTVAQKLNVATVLEGSVRKSGQRIRITAQLIDAASDSHLWSEAYDRTLDDIFAVQADIANAVVAELRAALLGEHANSGRVLDVEAEVQAAASGRSDDPEAYRLYLQGRFYVLRITEADVARGVGFYRQALDRDPAFALAWAGLSRAYHAQAGRGWLPVAEGMEHARDAAQRALALVPDLAEGHIALAWVLADYDWDWRSAQSELERALALAPGDGDVHRASASLAMQLGRAEEAIVPARRAVALDPLSKPAHVVLGDCCMRAGRLDEAVASLHSALDLAPNAGITHYIVVVRATAAGSCGRGARRGRPRTDSLSAPAVRGAGAAHDRRCVRLRRGVAATDRRSRRRRVVSDRGRVMHGAAKSTRPSPGWSAPTPVAIPGWANPFRTRCCARCTATRAGRRSCAEWDWHSARRHGARSPSQRHQDSGSVRRDDRHLYRATRSEASGMTRQTNR